jgi:hypothetical protein
MGHSLPFRQGVPVDAGDVGAGGVRGGGAHQPPAPRCALVQVFLHLGLVALLSHLASHDLRPVAPGRLPGITLKYETSLLVIPCHTV